MCSGFFFFFQAEDGIRDKLVTGVQTCALPIFALRQAAVFRSPGSYVASPASSSVTLIWRRSTARIVPSWMGSSYVLPVRLSVTDRVLFDTRIVLGNGSRKITTDGPQTGTDGRRYLLPYTWPKELPRTPPACTRRAPPPAPCWASSSPAAATSAACCSASRQRVSRSRPTPPKRWGPSSTCSSRRSSSWGPTWRRSAPSPSRPHPRDRKSTRLNS